MDRFEYAIGLMSIIVGLGLADLAMSLHRLLKHRTQVRWDGLSIATAAYAAYTLIRMWYALWTVREVAVLTNLFFYISLILEMFVLFLAAAVALPDDSDPIHERWDLRAYHQRHARYIWMLFALFQVSFLGHLLYFLHASGPHSLPSWFWPLVVAPLAIFGALLVVRSRRLQAALLGTAFTLELMNGWSTGL
jgi:hypothetical protein